jgi:hypothetical protein
MLAVTKGMGPESLIDPDGNVSMSFPVLMLQTKYSSSVVLRQQRQKTCG